MQREIEYAEFIDFEGVKAPVVSEESRNVSLWQAVPGKVRVSGGKKFADVRFVKDDGGVTKYARPGELLDFGESTKNVRLRSVDTVLEGRYELRAFNLLCDKLAEKPELVGELSTAKGVSEALPKKRAGKLPDADSFCDRAAEIFSILAYLRDVDGGSAEYVPPVDPRFKHTPFVRRKLAEFAQLINIQLGSVATNDAVERPAKGMTVIVGPRGTGKNKLVEQYAALTNRPLYRYACSPDKEERDLTYDVELSDGEVVKVPTRILTSTTTPDAILELDEVNLLRPSVAKFFNALFDDDRAIFLNGQVVRAAEGTIFVGLMNPADYNGVEDLPDTIDDRSNVMTLGYPPLKYEDPVTGQETFNSDEALILKDEIAPLQKYTDEQFLAFWERAINGVGTVDIPADIAQIITDVKNIALIAHRSRQTVEAYKTRASDARMERDISLRGSIEAARFYAENRLWGVDPTTYEDWKEAWGPAHYAVVRTYMPHTDTYRRGKQDQQAIEVILAEGIR